MTKNHNGYKSIIKNASFLYVSLLFNQVLRVVYIVFLARYLGPELYGVWAFGLSWYLAFLPLILFGLGPTIVKAISKDRKTGSQIANLIFSIRFFLIIIVSLLCAVTGYFISDNSQVVFLLLIFSVALIGRSISVWGDQMFQAYEVTHLTFEQEKYFRSSEVLIGMFVAYFTHNILFVALTHAIIWNIQGLRAIYLVEIKLQNIRFVWEWNRVVQILKFSFPIGLSLFFNGLIFQGAIIIYKQMGVINELIGNLAIVIQAQIILGSIFLSIGKAALPVLARSADRKDRKDEYYLDVMIRLAFVFGIIVGVSGLTFGTDIVDFFLGDNYTPAMNYLGLMLWILIPFIIRSAVNTILIIHDYFWASLFIEGIGLLTMFVSVLTMASYSGFQGVIVALIFSYSILAILGLFISYKLKLMRDVHQLIKLILLLVCSLGIYLFTINIDKWLAYITSLSILILGISFLSIIRDDEKKKIGTILREKLNF